MILKEKNIPFSIPLIGDAEISSVVESLRSGWLTSGPKVKLFEKNFSEFVCSRNSIAVSSCTAGLHLSLLALDIGPGDEVLLPSFTFCSTVNVVEHCGAKPIFVDIDDDFNISIENLRRKINKKTKAIIPVHFSGNPCHLYEIYSIASEHHLFVIEDAAHAIGATYNQVRIGSDKLQKEFPELTRTTCFSFYATKNITTGEGGMVVTKDDELSDKIRVLSLHGMSRDAWKRYSDTGSWFYEVLYPGYKYNMTDIQAAIGIHQLKRLPEFIDQRQSIARKYDIELGKLSNLKIPINYNDRTNAYHLYVIKLVLESMKINRSEFINQLNKMNISTSVHFIPVHLQPYYKNKYKIDSDQLPKTEEIFEQIISLPIYPKMSDNDVVKVIRTIIDIISKFSKFE